MGRKITASRAGTCPDCGEDWKVNDQIFWDNSIKNSKNWNVTCSDEECFKNQGGTLTTFKPKSGYSKASYTPREQDDLTVELPKVEVSEDVATAVNRVDNLFLAAHTLTKKRYPKLKETSQTFGMVRSKFIDQIMFVLYNS